MNVYPIKPCGLGVSVGATPAPDEAGAVELKPCPLDGAAVDMASVSHPYVRFWAKCSGCGLTSPRRKTRKDVIDFWNARALSPPPVVEEARLLDDQCTVPPEGWWCCRPAGHEGPCAARPEPPKALIDAALAAWRALPDDERSGERPFVMGFNAGWDEALAPTPPTGEEAVEQRPDILSRTEAWLRECSSWLLGSDLDMQCPMEADPLDLADDLAALPSPSPRLTIPDWLRDLSEKAQLPEAGLMPWERGDAHRDFLIACAHFVRQALSNREPSP